MNRASELKYLLLIITIFIAACIETDIYLPAFADMMTFFHANEGEIQSLLTWNFLGICIACPLYGPLSDAFGRKKPLMIALSLFLLGSVITLFAQDLQQMSWGRILQGLGSGGCFTLGTAIIFDAFEKNKAIQAVNQLNTIIPLIMAAAPMLGAYLNHSFGFRANFLIITFFVMMSLFICLLFFRETHPCEKRSTLQIKSILLDFKEAFTSLPFWQITLIISMIFAGYIAFLSGTSVLFVVEFHMSKSVYPFVQALLLGGWVFGSLVLNRSISKWGKDKVKRLGTICCILGGLAATFFALCFPKDPYFVTLAMALYAFGANWMIGLYFPEGMEILSRIKGIAASILTSVRLAIAALVVALAGAIYNATIYPLAGIIFATIAIIFPTIFYYERTKKLEDQSDIAK